MKKLLLTLTSIAALSTAFTASAQDDVQPAPVGSQYVLNIKASDGYPKDLDVAEWNYSLLPLDDNNDANTKYSTQGLEDIILHGYTTSGKPAKYIYTLTYYTLGCDYEGEETNTKRTQTYTVFVGENDPDVKLSVCARYPAGKSYVEWLHNFSNVVLGDGNLFSYLYIGGNTRPVHHTSFNSYSGTYDSKTKTGYYGTTFNYTKIFSAAEYSGVNLNDLFLKGRSSNGLSLIDIDDTAVEGKTGANTAVVYPEGVYNVALDCATGKLTVTPASSGMELYVGGVATVAAPFDFALPAGLKAYTLAYDADAQALVASQIKGEVKAYTPVLLKSENTGFYTLKIASEEIVYNPVQLEVKDNTNKAAIADSRTDGNVLVGVNQPHWIDAFPAVKARYTLSGESFKINGAAKNFDTPITPQYSCYVELPVELAEAPASLQIIFPTEEEPVETVLYVHFTDEYGNYKSTHYTELYGVENVFTASIDFENNEYFVLADACFDNEEAAEEAYALGSDWNSLDGNIYHQGEVVAYTGNSYSWTMTKTPAGEAENIVPFRVEPGCVYELNVDMAGEVPALSSVYMAITGVENVSVSEPAADNRIFDLFGRRVDETYKGIAIKNGKKIFLR